MSLKRVNWFDRCCYTRLVSLGAKGYGVRTRAQRVAMTKLSRLGVVVEHDKRFYPGPEPFPERPERYEENCFDLQAHKRRFVGEDYKT